MAVVVLPEPEGPVRQTKGFWGCADKMDAAAELILSWNTSSQRRTNCVSFWHGADDIRHVDDSHKILPFKYQVAADGRFARRCAKLR